MMDDVCSLWTHHLLGVALALGNRRQYPRLGRMDIAYTAVLEHSADELFDLHLQYVVGHRLFEEVRNSLLALSKHLNNSSLTNWPVIRSLESSGARYVPLMNA